RAGACSTSRASAAGSKPTISGATDAPAERCRKRAGRARPALMLSPRSAPAEVVIIDFDHLAAAYVDQQQVVIMADISEISSRLRQAPAAVVVQPVGRRIIGGPQRRSHPELLIFEGCAPAL